MREWQRKRGRGAGESNTHTPRSDRRASPHWQPTSFTLLTLTAEPFRYGGASLRGTENLRSPNSSFLDTRLPQPSLCTAATRRNGSSAERVEERGREWFLPPWSDNGGPRCAAPSIGSAGQIGWAGAGVIRRYGWHFKWLISFDNTVVAEDTLTAPSPPPTPKPTTIPTQPTPDVGANYYPRSSAEVVFIFIKAFVHMFAVTPAAFSLLQCIYLTLRKPFKDFRMDFLSVRILKMRVPRDQRSKYRRGIFMYVTRWYFLNFCGCVVNYASVMSSVHQQLGKQAVSHNCFAIYVIFTLQKLHLKQHLYQKRCSLTPHKSIYTGYRWYHY